MQKVGAFAIILDADDRVLLCHRTDMDAWNLPGGAVEPMEAPWDAARREVSEEVGLEVQVEKLLGVYAIPSTETIAFTFLCVQAGGCIRLSDEADDIQWFHQNHLPATTLPRHAERIADLRNNCIKASLRVQA
ncbi:NUDIX hydrolase [Halomonas sp. 18071143]|uniref:NUDIX hydrolase n=1 Tax=Halomonas sp. 18071143 TaxID=2855441 RepID=UPI001C44E26C|nr:NUDIX domain-containing protein [Halomonas sp. 18071143]